MILRVTQYGEPILREKGASVTEFNDKLKQFARDMLETMYDEEGIGLAAQQVDVAKQIFVMDLQLGDRPIEFHYEIDGKSPPLELIMPLVVVNPQIVTREPSAPYEEGCLSFPSIRGEVVRDTVVEMQYQDLEGASHTIVCDGLFARVILHENDHLQGVLFIDHMTPLTLRPLQTKIKKLKRSTRDWIKHYG
ncbi:peptide deformylase [Cerasicoccus arenae]|uniref:Peptide deformylase n=1 Tax=Cerasicoccus arenae TaxID=424488 RepID=A0A8J3GEI5_9BACT|nr:peptide deformylase [Cerasicoccus arenae]MBK1856709.1 peptide deformylase [Cerasicoccus arenae]GHB99055.1 peptide deformylase 1 [Cerasicoccus arenae]